MKLLTLNVAVFEANNSKLIKFLKEENPDIGCFQEVTRGLDEYADKDYISKDTIDSGTPNLKYRFFGPTTVFGEVDMKEFHGKREFHFDPKGTLEMGNYTKSKYRITNARCTFLDGEFSLKPDEDRWPDEQQRAIVVTDMNVGGGQELRVINYHGIWTRDKKGNDRTYQACKKMLNFVAKEKRTIICGDFNLFPETPSIRIFEKDFVSLVNLFKVKSTRPFTNELSGSERNVVDYIFVDRDIKVNSFGTVDNDVSDHLPLVLDFAL
jgi:endonuclease/exonuclease/phosphatase family metal-dependent hydrolase